MSGESEIELGCGATFIEALDRVIRSGHDFDAVRREVRNVKHAAGFIEGDIGGVAADRNDGPESGCGKRRATS